MKSVVIFLLVIAIITGGFAYVSLFSQPTRVVEEARDVKPFESTKEPELPLSGVGSLTALQLRDANLECQITYAPDESKAATVGNYFVSRGKIRGDFIMMAPELGNEVVSSIIVDSTNTYYWSVIDGSSFGLKMPNDTGAEVQAAEKREPVPMDANVRYVCTPWPIVDNSIFVPPTNVTFQDFGALMQAGMEYGN
jgi:hypothetical protein